MDETWLKAEALRRGVTPSTRLLAVFDALHAAFQQGGLVKFPLLEAHSAMPTLGPHARSFVEELAAEARLVDPQRFAEIWSMLLNGAVIAARAGDRDAAAKAKHAAEHVLSAWQRTDPA